MIAHVGALTTYDSVSLAQHAETVGAAGLMAVQPFYYQLSWRETSRYHQEFAAATSLPVIAYNFPAATGVRFNAEQIVELATRGYIAAVKDSVGDALLLNELLAAHSNDVVILNGWDALALDAFVPRGAWHGVGTRKRDPRGVRKALRVCVRSRRSEEGPIPVERHMADMPLLANERIRGVSDGRMRADRIPHRPTTSAPPSAR